MTYPDDAMDDGRLLESGIFSGRDMEQLLAGEPVKVAGLDATVQIIGTPVPATRLGPIYDPNPRRSD